MQPVSIPEGYEGSVTLAVKDGDGDWWMRNADGTWYCPVHDLDADNIEDIERVYLLEDIE